VPEFPKAWIALAETKAFFNAILLAAAILSLKIPGSLLRLSRVTMLHFAGQEGQIKPFCRPFAARRRRNGGQIGWKPGCSVVKKGRSSSIFDPDSVCKLNSNLKLRTAGQGGALLTIFPASCYSGEEN
jgi:hypothetical protein